MRTSLDCIPCLIRQALEAARFVTTDAAVHEQVVRQVLTSTAQIPLTSSPPLIAKEIHRQLREITGNEDPYRAAKEQFNRMALEMLPGLMAEVQAAEFPFALATRLAIAGNVIDLGVNGSLTEAAARESMRLALAEPFFGKLDQFREAVGKARKILYLADNAGEIVFDRLLIEQLSSASITLAVRGSPVINDATIADAQVAGLDEIVKVIDNGSDAPGTVLDDCSRDFRRVFAEADLIIAKGQGNFESLSGNSANIFFLFKVKCSVLAEQINLAIGTHVLLRSNEKRSSDK